MDKYFDTGSKEYFEEKTEAPQEGRTKKAVKDFDVPIQIQKYMKTDVTVEIHEYEIKD